MQANDIVGPYVFRLEVTDIKKQTDSATVSILVNKAANRPPGESVMKPDVEVLKTLRQIYVAVKSQVFACI